MMLMSLKRWIRLAALSVAGLGWSCVPQAQAQVQYPTGWWVTGWSWNQYWGATTARYAAEWDRRWPFDTVQYFYVESEDPNIDGRILGPDPYLYRNGFVAWRRSPNAEYWVVTDYYLYFFYFCEDHSCWWTSGGYPYGVQSNGDVYGATSCCNSQAVIWEYDEESRTHTAFVLPEWDAVTHRSESHCQLRLHNDDLQVFHRFDTNADGHVDNFDIDGVVEAIVRGTLTQTGFRLRVSDIDPFVDCLLSGCS